MTVSFRNFIAQRYASILRYPLSTIISVLIAIVAITHNHEYSYNAANGEYTDILARVIAALLFALPLSLVPWLMKQVNNIYTWTQVFIGQFVSLLFWLLFYYFLPHNFADLYGSDQSRVIISYIFAWILPLVWIVLASKIDSVKIRWRCQQFVIKWIIAVVALGIVWGWIAACLSSIEYLFGVYIDSKIYTDVRILTWSLVWVHIRLSGLVDDVEDRTYIKLFRFFWLYIFLPLAAIYALILLFYGLQICVTWNRPHGKVTRMIIWYTAFGLLGYLLTYPIRSEYKYIQSAHKAYFVSLLLFVLLLAAAIYIRIDEYGLTMERYIVCIIWLWIIIISIGSLYRNSVSLTLIICSFILLTGLMNYGPRSVHKLPVTLQYKRMTTLLNKNWFLNDGVIQPKKVHLSTGEVLSGDLRQVYEIASYLGSEQWIQIFKSLYGSSWFNQLTGVNRWNVADQFMVSLGVDNIFANAVNYNSRYLNFYSNSMNNNLNLYPIAGYTFLLNLSMGATKNLSQSWFALEIISSDNSKLTITSPGKGYTIDLQDHISTIVQSANRTQAWESMSDLMLTWSDYTLILNNISLEGLSDNTYVITNFDGILLLK